MTYKFKKKGPSTGEFWYDIAYGGYIKASDFSSDPATIKAIKAAVRLLQKCEKRCTEE